ncbi:MAG: hypothetical protein PGN13_16490 [Patulibacter minatonensis]
MGKPSMTAVEVKDALRKRHPAYSQGVIGEWTTLEEWRNIDLLAVSAWVKAENVGYEVKVSRSDYRSELLEPSKRALAVAGCHRFWFAVPAGLLKPEEIAWDEPSWEPGDFERERCPGIPEFGGYYRERIGLLGTYGGLCNPKSWRHKSGFTVEVPKPFAGEDYYRSWDGKERIPCPTCKGKGYVAKSRVEREAPTLWVPRDVGLIEVTARGCRVAKPAPLRKPEAPLVSQATAKLVRWVSVRPDPRHAGARLSGAA